jgi:hypothetical protein
MVKWMGRGRALKGSAIASIEAGRRGGKASVRRHSLMETLEQRRLLTTSYAFNGYMPGFPHDCAPGVSVDYSAGGGQGLMMPGGPPVTAQSITVTVTGLPDHSYIRPNWSLGNNWPEPIGDTDAVNVTIGDFSGSVTWTYPGPNPGYVETISGNIQGWLPHTGSTLTMTFEASGIETGQEIILFVSSLEIYKPTVTLSGPTANPISEANGEAVFTISRDVPSGLSPAALPVNLSFSGSATDGEDYESLLESVTIPAGQASASFTLKAKKDNLIEGAENTAVSITSGDYSVGSSSASLTISDDPPVVWIEAVDATATEHTEGGEADPAVFLVHRSGGDLAVPIEVDISFTGTATQGTDYSSPGSSISVGANAAINIDIIDDLDAEGIETIVVSLDDPGPTGNYLLASPATTQSTTAQAWIDDDIRIGTISVKRVPRNQLPKEPEVPVPAATIAALARDGHRYNGYSVHILVTVTGESLHKVEIRQDIKAKTSIIGFNGQPFTEQEVAAALPNAPDFTLNTGDFVLDGQAWDWNSLIIKNGSNNGVGYRYDLQSAGVPATPFDDGQGFRTSYSYQLTIERIHRITFRNKDTEVAIGGPTHWGYKWSNIAAKWTGADNPAFPANIGIEGAARHKNGNKGVFEQLEDAIMPEGLAGLPRI